MKQREIKFRGLTINDNMRYGLLANKGNDWFISNSAGSPHAFHVRPETIGQYTGLKDKNGKEIYEGDVVTYGTPYHGVINIIQKGEIVYNDYCACFQIKYKNIFDGSASDMCHKFTIIEVIGNIYETPYLTQIN